MSEPYIPPPSVPWTHFIPFFKNIFIGWFFKSLKLLSLTFDVNWNSITTPVSFINFKSSFPDSVFKSSEYNPWPILHLGISCSFSNDSFTHIIDFLTLFLKLSFSPACILIVKSLSSSLIYLTISFIAGCKSDISFISSPIKSLPTTYGLFATALSTLIFSLK